MNKIRAFILSFLITLLIFFNYYFVNLYNEGNNRESVLIESVVDGDTIKVEGGNSIRLLNINTPEKNMNGYEKAKLFLKEFEGSIVEIEYEGYDKYGRQLARVYSPEYLNLEIIERGYGNKFLVSKSEIKKFASAERRAIEMEKGIWNKSKYYGCFEAKIKQKEEIVYLKNKCEKINLKGWIIKDESRKNYKFNDIYIGAIVIHSNKGENNETDIFIQRGDIWNDDRDTLYLFDNEGKIAYYLDYGY